jgi:hypothetical protein
MGTSLAAALMVVATPAYAQTRDTFSRQDAIEKPLLEKELERALQKGNTNLPIKISHMLAGLNRYISSSNSIIDFVKSVSS